MSTQLRCDFGGEQIKDDEAHHKIGIDGKEYDCCDGCYWSHVILAEVRKTRTRKPAPKIGRPKGSRKKAEVTTSTVREDQLPVGTLITYTEGSGPEIQAGAGFTSESTT